MIFDFLSENLIPDPLAALLIPIPRLVIPDPGPVIPDPTPIFAFDPWSHIPRYDRVSYLYLLKRGYKRNFVTKQMQRAANIPRTIALETKDVLNKPTRIPFITNFNPSLPHISNIIKNITIYCSLLTAAKRFFHNYLL